MSRSLLWFAVFFGLAGSPFQASGLQYRADLSSNGQVCGAFYNGAPQCSPINLFAGQGSCDSDAPFCAGGSPGQTSAAACQDTPFCAGLCPPHWGLSDIGNDPGSDVIGLVAGGYVDNANNANCDLPGYPACKEPHLSNDDLCHHHRDRDINIVILPATSWDRTSYDPRWSLRDNLNGWDVGAPMGAINTEIEWRHLFPTIRSAGFDNGPANDGNVSLRPAQFPGACGVWSNSGDCKLNLGVPHSGDDIYVRGRVVRDCGHIQVTGPTEIHPFTGVMWLHLLANDNNGATQSAADGVIWLRLLSHEAHPVQNYTPANSIQRAFSAQGPTRDMVGRFHVPGYPSPTGEILYIGPVKSDWVLDPNHGVSAAPVAGCDCRSFPDPVPSEWGCNLPSGGWQNAAGQVATAPGDMNYHQATDIFSISIVDDLATNPGFVKVTASFKGVPPGETDTNTDLPFIVGAHAEICYPTCDANGCQTNNCPGMCKKAANCVGGYTTNFDVNGDIAVPLALTYNTDVTIGVANTMPGVNVAGTGVGNLDVWTGATPSYPAPVDSYRMELLGLRPYFGNGNWGAECSSPYLGGWTDGTQVRYGFPCHNYTSTWRYNAVTGQISIARTTPNAQPDSTAKCLDTQGHGTARGTNVVINTCDPNSLTQRWTIDQGRSTIPGTPSGLINSINNVGSGLCLADRNGSYWLYLEDCLSITSGVNLSWGAF